MSNLDIPDKITALQNRLFIEIYQLEDTPAREQAIIKLNECVMWLERCKSVDGSKARPITAAWPYGMPRGENPYEQSRQPRQA
jgi:hypothetical protein